MPPTRFADVANASGQVTTASGRAYGRRPPMPPPAPPRAPAQQAYASANPNASFQRAPTAMARPPMPPVRAQTLPAYGSANAMTEQGRPVATGPQYAMGAQARTMPAGPAYANANPNASFQRPTAGTDTRYINPGPQPTINQAMANDRRIAAQGGVTAADMVDVPGFGQMPRALLAKLQQRMQQQQAQQPPQMSYASRGNTPQQSPRSPEDIARRMIAAGDTIDANGMVKYASGIEPATFPGPDVVAAYNRLRQGGGPPVRAMPAPRQWQGEGQGARPVGAPYGNDNIGVGVVPPGGFDQARPYVPPAQLPAVAQLSPPAPPPAAPLNQLTMTPNGQQMVANGAANLAQQQVTSPTPTSAPPGNPNDYWWDGTKGAWQYIDRAAEAGARNAAMVPPAPPVSPIAGHLWGGGPEAFGAGRSPVATSMTDFYGAFGSGIPGQPVPTQQQLYDRFNANPTNPYMQAGAVNNGNTVFNGPSWY